MASIDLLLPDTACTSKRCLGTISHHHGVGTDHKQWFEQEKGDIGLAALKGVKQAIDPDGVLNPNKAFG